MNNNTDEKAVETLCKAIVQTVRESNSSSDDIVCSVVNTEGDYVNVFIMGNQYKVKNGIGVKFSAGDRALVHCINGDFKNKIIIAKM